MMNPSGLYTHEILFDKPGNKLDSYQCAVYIETMDMVEIIRDEIRKSKINRRQISLKSGVSQEQLCRLMQGKTLTAETSGVLLDYFGYELKKKARRK